MSDPSANKRNIKRRRAVLASVGLLAALTLSGLVFTFVEKVREASDRAT